MPYFITVLALVFIGVGFTLFHQNEETLGLTQETPIVTTETGVPSPTTTPTESIVVDEVVTESVPAEVVVPIETTPITAEVPTPTQATPAPVAAPVSTNDYTNGNYASQMSYRTPDGTYTMDVTLTVSNDKITAATLGFDSDGARDGYSKRFANAYKSTLIGQDLGSASLSRVGGASLTTRAFNNAISSIRTQAS